LTKTLSQALAEVNDCGMMFRMGERIGFEDYRPFRAF